MQNKKNKGADLERFRFAMLFLGLGIAVVGTLSAFEFSSFTNQRAAMDDMDGKALNEELFDLPEEEEPEKDEPEPPVTEPEPEPLPPVLPPDPSIGIQDTSNGQITTGPIITHITPPVTPPPPTLPPVDVPEKMAEFPGGTEALYKYLGENLSYPSMARDQGIQGKVYVKFVVSSTGQISKIKVLRGIGGGCDEAAEIVVGNMPKWTPGEVAGEPVASYFTLPIKFVLE